MKLEMKDRNGPKIQLEEHCRQKGYDPPKYFSTLTKFRKYEGKVCIEGLTYSTHPLDYSSEGEADVQAALVALTNIIDVTVSSDSIEEITNKIYECIAGNGLIMKYLPNIFE